MQSIKFKLCILARIVVLIKIAAKMFSLIGIQNIHRDLKMVMKGDNNAILYLLSLSDLLVNIY